MNESQYGQMAPRLPDGTLLIQEEVLTPAQTESVQADEKLFAEDKSVAKKSWFQYRLISVICLVVLAINAVLALLNASGTLDFNPASTSSVTLIALFIPIWVRNRMKDESGRRTVAQYERLSSAGATVPLAMVKRFLLDRDEQLRIYGELLLNKSTSVGKVFHVKLDTANTSKYIVRVVQDPPSAAKSEP